MAQNTYTGQDDGGYLSTDPYAGSYGGGFNFNPSPTMPGNTGVTGYGPGGVTPPTVEGGPAGAGASQTLGPGMTRDQVYAYVQDLYKQKGVTPNSTDLNYWTDRYFDPAFKGDYTYWNDKLNNQNESFGGGGAAGGGNGGYGGSWNHAPSLDDLKNMPGFQFALKNGQDIVSRGEFAHGTGLTGGALKDLSDYTTNMSLNQAFFPYWQAQNNSNNSNLDNLYKFSNLGYNASSYGPNSPA